MNILPSFKMKQPIYTSLKAIGLIALAIYLFGEWYNAGMFDPMIERLQMLYEQYQQQQTQ